MVYLPSEDARKSDNRSLLFGQIPIPFSRAAQLQLYPCTQSATSYRDWTISPDTHKITVEKIKLHFPQGVCVAYGLTINLAMKERKRKAAAGKKNQEQQTSMQSKNALNI